MEVRKTAHKGWGVFATEAILEGTFILEYVGEIITNEEAERRGALYDSTGCSHLFDLDYAAEAGDACYSIDATSMGNCSRFVNHSCDPNMQNYQAGACG